VYVTDNGLIPNPKYLAVLLNYKRLKLAKVLRYQ